ncbi:Flp family type IVb pilin [Actinospongicola halichondriae]|uniref:Flp family type IVb pilin n=1 Tax=Actinospongicola halichondriae TaxID=3236844 RepID=UPI003D3E9B2C
MTRILTTLRIQITSRHADRGDRGASLVEYGLLVALIAIVCLTAVFFLGNETSEEFQSIGSSIDSAT